MNADELAKILDELGQRLGPTGEYVFALAVRQSLIWGISGMVVVLVLGAVGTYVLVRTARSDSYDRDLGFIVGGALAFSAMLLAVIVLPYLLNPEYAALRDLIGTIR